MKLLSLDFETTGLSPETDAVTEVGLALYDCEVKQPVRITGFLVKTDKIITEEVTRITGITKAMLDAYGIDSRPALNSILQLAKNADYMLAHNGNDFDKLFLEAWCKRENLTAPQLPWIDSKIDLPPDAYLKGANLFVMAAHAGFLFDGHRAVNDVLAVLKIVARYDIEVIVKRALTANVHARAVISYDDRLLAKSAGFHWKPEMKRWEISVKADELTALKERVTFPVVQIEEAAQNA